MLVRMPRRSPNPSIITKSPRTYLSLVLASLLVGCAESPSKWTLLDLRDQSKQVELTAPKNAAQSYWIVPFSSRIEESSSQKVEVVQSSFSTPNSSTVEYAMKAHQHLEQKNHIQTRAALTNLQSQLLASPKNLASLYLSPRAQTQGNINILSPFTGENFQPISGILKASSTTTNIYVDARYENDFSTDTANSLLKNFDLISLPRLRKLFGSESDIDKNKRIDIFLSSKDKLGSGIVGFFRPIDLLPNIGVGSNEREIIYVRIPDSSLPLELFDATLAHETFHLINFGQKTLRILQETNGQSILIEDLFLNEGLAHLAEELSGWSVCTPLIVKQYLNCISKTSLVGKSIDDDSDACASPYASGDSIPRRGGMMLFLLYLFQQAGDTTFSKERVDDIQGPGVTWLQRLNQSNRVGLDNLEHYSDASFFSLYSSFLSALLLDLNNPLDSKYEFAPEFQDPYTFQTRNIRMNSTRTDSTNVQTNLMGPEILPLDNPLSIQNFIPTGAKIYEVTLAPGEKRTLSFQSNSSLGLGTLVIQKP